MIKVVHVISDTNVGGAGVHLCNLLSAADRNRFSYAVVLPQGSALVPRLIALNIPAIGIRHGADRSCDFSAVPELFQVIPSLAPHIVHTHGAFYGRIAAKLHHVPIIVSTRHCANMHQAEGSSLHKYLTNRLDRHFCSHTIATADYVRDVLISQGYRRNRVTVIHNGSLPPPPLSSEEKNLLRSELGIKEGDLAVGMVARLAHGKGHETFLRAVKLCAARNDRILFFIIGSGERESELKQIASRLGIARRVSFLGFRTDAKKLMEILDINVNCSEHSETSSLSLSEGMSVGAVPIVTDCGGNPYMAGFGKNGIVFPINDDRALASAILKLAEERQTLSALSACCQVRFEQEFTAQRMATRIEALYKRLFAEFIAQS